MHSSFNYQQSSRADDFFLVDSTIDYDELNTNNFYYCQAVLFNIRTCPLGKTAVRNMGHCLSVRRGNCQFFTQFQPSKINASFQVNIPLVLVDIGAIIQLCDGLSFAFSYVVRIVKFPTMDLPLYNIECCIIIFYLRDKLVLTFTCDIHLL